MRALSSGNLKAMRDNEGNWQISLSALEDWMSMRRTPDRHPPVMTVGHAMATPQDTPETIAKLAASETEIRMLREQMADLRADRDALREALSQAALQPQASPSRLGFFKALFRQKGISS